MDYENNLKNNFDALTILDGKIQNTTIEGLTAVCGDRDFQSISVLGRALMQRCQLLIGGVRQLLNILTCENIVPLYVRNR